MKINYYPETDSLYIDLSLKTSVESREVSPGIVLDYRQREQKAGFEGIRSK
jgi:uncharacterized protein YuzE